MNFENVKFISIGSNCADIWYLGKNRTRGPVDNIVLKTAKAVEDLLTGKFFDKIYTECPKIEDKNWQHQDDLKYILNYKDFKIVHNDPATDKFKEEFKKRLEQLDIALKDKNFWFVFNFNSYFLSKNHYPTREFFQLFDLLKNNNLLDRIIFVQLKVTNPIIEQKWNVWLSDKVYLKNLITIYNVTEADQAAEQFKTQASKILERS